MSFLSNRVFLIALILSLIFHIAILLGFMPKYMPQDFERKPLTVEMVAYSLNDNKAPDHTKINQTEIIPGNTITTPNSPPKIDIEKTHTPIKEAKNKQKTKPLPQEESASNKQEDIKNEKDIKEQIKNHEVLDATDKKSWEALNQLQDDHPNKLGFDLSKESENSSLTEENIEPFKSSKPYDIIRPTNGQNPPFPHTAKIRYQGPLSITGEMIFKRSKTTYSVHATFNIPTNKMEFISEGKIEGNTLIPLKYTDKRKGKIYASAIFDYDHHVIHYGKGENPSETYPIKGQALDFFSLPWQLAISGGKIGQFTITNGKKGYTLIGEHDSSLEEIFFDTGEGKLRLYILPPMEKNIEKTDTIEYGFAPDFANIPGLIKFTTDKKTTYQLQVIDIELDGHNYWQAMRKMKKTK